jgi:hypothetical protein
MSLEGKPKKLDLTNYFAVHAMDVFFSVEIEIVSCLGEAAVILNGDSVDGDLILLLYGLVQLSR